MLDRFGESMSELEAEIADDFFIFRKEDAQKLLEPPHAESLRISPSTVRLEPGSEAVFKVECFDQYGKPFEVGGVDWSSPEGAIDASGRLEVDDFQGVFVVTAKSRELEAETQVTVATATTPPPPLGDRFIHWEGEIPTQRWMQFCTKVLASSATDVELELHVSVWLPTSAEQAEAKLNETRAALCDLGLDGDADVAD